MTFTLKIKTGNDAMRHSCDVTEALFKVAHDIGGRLVKGETGVIRDINGNTVGSWKVG